MKKQTIVFYTALCSLILSLGAGSAHADINVTIRGTIVSNCTVTDENLEFDHGTIDVAEVSDAPWVARAIVIQCTGPADIVIGDTETLDIIVPLTNEGGVNTATKLCLPGCTRWFGVSMRMAAGRNEVMLNSKLQGTFAPGPFNGVISLTFTVL